jgi:integrase
MADSFLVSGVVDLSVALRSGPVPVSDESRGLLDRWETRLREEGLATQTVAKHVTYATWYVAWVEATEGCDVGAAPVSSVDGFLMSLRPTWAASSLGAVTSRVAAFTRFAGREDLADGFALVRTRPKHCPVPVLTVEEKEAVAEACGRASSRDSAITLLALLTGLRGCDIAGLMLDGIDWRMGRISLVQQKTGNPLTIPLPAAAGNALSDYLLHERPLTTDRHVFILSRAPYTGLSTRETIRQVIKKVFEDAGVRPHTIGTRLTRHNVASGMLAAEVDHPVISAVLGHTDPVSVDSYLDMNVEQLRCCVLPLPEAVRS